MNWKAFWDRIDSLVASWQRPYATYMCATGIFLGCLNSTTAPIALPLAAAIVGGNIAARTVEKTKAITADIESKRIDANAAINSNTQT
jgi:hypothetical protein